MATPSQQQRPVSNSNPNSGSSSRWPKTESGSPFSGFSRGRGGHGRGRGRGGRGGGPSRDPKTSADVTDKSTDSRTKLSPSPSVSEKQPSPVVLPAPAIEKTPVPPSTTAAPAKPKGPSRRASRSIPSVSVTSSPSIPEAAPILNTTPRNQNKKRRSHHGKSSTASKAPTPPDEHLLHPQKARSGPAPPRDTPPHLASFDMRTNIDALVERVRAVAMAENRPSTPGSHIDWAGDDDDTLPDLDDWGVTTNGSAISPIMMDGLKALPDVPDPTASTQPASTSSASLSPIPRLSPLNPARDVSPNTTSPLKVDDHPLPPKPSTQNSTNLPQHPSLPPRPTGFKDPHRGGRGSRQPRNNQNKNQAPQVEPKQVDIPAAERSAVTKAEVSRAPPTIDALTNLDTISSQTASLGANKAGGVPTSVHAPKEDQGVAASIHAPRPEEISTTKHPDQGEVSLHAPKAVDGLAASIHAPRGPSDSFSAPSYISSYDLPESRSHPTHTRAQTVGRTPPHLRSGDHIPRNGRSGFTSPRGGKHHNQHNRTHSSPNFGGAPHRAPHETRPRITGEAISKLARTIGSSGLSSPRVSTITTNE